ncbi:MAG: hypothetical protein GX786_03135 [Clostridiales bacterium]|nr:hypothetical protein [Clostridiales bacterium]
MYYALYVQKQKKSAKLPLFFSGLLVYLGVSLRRDAFILTVLPFLFTFLLQFLFDWYQSKKFSIAFTAYKQKFFSIIVVLIPLVLLIGINTLVTAHLYQDYHAFNTARSTVIDFPKIDYQNHQDAFSQLHLSENDNEMIRIWNFDDSKVFTTEHMVSLATLSSTQKKAVFPSLSIVAENFYTYIRSNLFTLLLTAFLTVLLLNSLKYQCMVSIIFLLLMGMVGGFLFFVQRFPIWVQDPLSFTFILLLLLFLPKKSETALLQTQSPPTKASPVLIGCVWLCIVGLLFAMTSFSTVLRSFTTEKEPATPTNGTALYDYFYSHPDHLYVVDTLSVSSNSYFATSVFSSQPVGYLQNSILTGSWQTKHPVDHKQKQLLHLQTDSLYETLYRDTVYFVSQFPAHSAMVLHYLQEHYHPLTQMTIVDIPQAEITPGMEEYVFYQFHMP